MGRLILNIRMATLAICVALTGIGYAQTYTFTNATGTGANGPTQLMTDAEYAGTSLDGNVTVTGGIQYWTVPTSGSYHITAYGAQGGGAFGGLGAQIEGDFLLTAGQVIRVLVGQQGETQAGQPESVGGGGGSFVVLDPALLPSDILVIAGGGGGSASNAFAASADGSITNDGNNGVVAAGVGNPNGAGGTTGNGGSKSVTGCSLDRGSGGGGFLTDGESICQSVGVGNGGSSFLNGGAGGTGTGPGAIGGFGGGGATWQTGFRGSGGGGGYSGGGAGQINSVSPNHAGGGGGSFNAGTTPLATVGVQSGNGLVVITLNCVPGVGTLLADTSSLPDLTADCILETWTPPTATNDCNATYNGTPDVSLPINAVGTTVVTWTYDDGTNITTQTQNVIITGIDTAPPVPDNPNLITFSNQCSFTPGIPTATDFCQGVINGVPDVTFPITTQGTTTITWTYDDGFGNTATQTQDIIINDISAPAPDVATLADYEGCNEATPATPTATDNCLGSMDGVPDVTFPITTAGTTVVTWTYDDGNGNVTTQTQNVIVSLIDLTVSSMGTQLIANQTGASYVWIDCGTGQPIAGATGQGYQPTVTGQYAAIVTTSNCSDTTECVLVDFTGIDELNSDYINIYPNPTNTGVFTVDFDGVVDHITVVDALGREVAVSVDLTTGAVNGSNLEAGRYTVRVFASDTVHSKGLVIIE